MVEVCGFCNILDFYGRHLWTLQPFRLLWYKYVDFAYVSMYAIFQNDLNLIEDLIYSYIVKKTLTFFPLGLLIHIHHNKIVPYQYITLYESTQLTS